jgi:hypothetical protein
MFFFAPPGSYLRDVIGSRIDVRDKAAACCIVFRNTLSTFQSSNVYHFDTMLRTVVFTMNMEPPGSLECYKSYEVHTLLKHLSIACAKCTHVGPIAILKYIGAA